MRRLREWVRLTTLAIFLAAVYELKIAMSFATPIRMFLFITLGAVLAQLLAQAAGRALGESRWIRRLVLGRAFVEGLWHIQTFDVDQPRPVANGLASMSYAGPDLQLVVDVQKFDQPHSVLPTRSRSLSASVSPHNLSYLNEFEYTVDDDRQFGVAIGHFSCVDGRGIPDRYDGRLFFFDRRAPQRQIAVRIPRRIIRRHKKQHPGVWRRKLLEELAQETLQ